MKKIFTISLILLLCEGCSGGIYTEVVEMDVRIASPALGLNSRVPVVYPAQVDIAVGDPMVQAFGPSWESIEKGYPAFDFNP